MPARSGIVAVALAFAALAARSRAPPTADASLQRDLEMARGQGLELAPQGGTQLVSANELLPTGSRRTTSAAPRRVSRIAAPAPERVSKTDAPTPAAPAPVAKAPARDSVVAAAPATPRPTAQGAVSPPPPGGYKTMGDIIRHAPFPINP